MTSQVFTVRLLNPGNPDKESQSDQKIILFKQFQIEPIKFPVPNNEISASSLWCLHDYGIAYQ